MRTRNVRRLKRRNRRGVSENMSSLTSRSAKNTDWTVDSSSNYRGIEKCQEQNRPIVPNDRPARALLCIRCRRIPFTNAPAKVASQQVPPFRLPDDIRSSLCESGIRATSSSCLLLRGVTVGQRRIDYSSTEVQVLKFALISSKLRSSVFVGPSNPIGLRSSNFKTPPTNRFETTM